MIRRLLLSIAVVVGATAVSAQGPAPPVPVVVVRGEGEVRATPDVAFVTIATEHRGNSAKDAQAQGATAMTAVQQRLAAAGLAKDAIRTLSYDVQPQFDYVGGKQVPRGFLARNVIEVRARRRCARGRGARGGGHRRRHLGARRALRRQGAPAARAPGDHARRG